MTFSERIQEYRENFEATGSTFQAGLLIPEVVDDEYFETFKPEQKFYKCRQYERKTEVDSDLLKERLNELVKQNVPKSPILSYNKRKNAFIDENKNNVLNELQKELNKDEDLNEAQFNKEEKEIEKEENEKFEKKYNKQLAEYQQIFNPSNEWLEKKFKDYFDRIIEKWGGKVWLASGASVRVEKNNSGENKYTIRMQVDNLTEFSDSYPYKYSITAAGNLSQRVKTDKQIEEEYAQNVCAYAFIYSVCLFNVCLDAKEVMTSCYINHIDSSTGNEEYRYLYSVIVPRELVKSFRMENLNTVAALMSLEGRADIRKEREIYFIDPLEWNLEHVSDNYEEDDSDNEEQVSIDFRRLNYDIDLPEPYYTFLSKIPDQLEGLKNVCFEKVREFEVCDNDFDEDNYANGLQKFMTLLIIVKNNPHLLESENYEKLLEFFKQFYGKSQYAMGEIQKLIDKDILPRIARNEPVNLDKLSYFMFYSLLGSHDEE